MCNWAGTLWDKPNQRRDEFREMELERQWRLYCPRKYLDDTASIDIAGPSSLYMSIRKL